MGRMEEGPLGSKTLPIEEFLEKRDVDQRWFLECLEELTHNHLVAALLY